MSISIGLPRNAQGSFDSLSVLPAVTLAAASVAPPVLPAAAASFSSWKSSPLLDVRYNVPRVPRISSEAPS